MPSCRRTNKHHRVKIRGVMGVRHFEFTLNDNSLSYKELGKAESCRATLPWERVIGYVLIFTEPVQEMSDDVRHVDTTLKAPDPKLPDKSFRLSFGEDGLFVTRTAGPGMTRTEDPWYLSWRSLINLGLRGKC